jgi:hypothetical protein
MLTVAVLAATLLAFAKHQRLWPPHLNHWDEAFGYMSFTGLATHFAEAI